MKINDRERKIISSVINTCVNLTLKRVKLTRVACNVGLVQRIFLGIHLFNKRKNIRIVLFTVTISSKYLQVLLNMLISEYIDGSFGVHP